MPGKRAASQYPVSLEIDYPNRELNRLTSFFRIVAVIPILAVFTLLNHQSWTSQQNPSLSFSTAGGILFLPTLLMILFRQKYPRWWFDWNVNLTRFSLRVGAYATLLTDKYPSTDEEQGVHADISYPDVKKELSPPLVLVKWFLALPHYIVLCFLFVVVILMVLIAWFAILFTGRYPKPFFDFVVGVFRWSLRVQSYAFLLVTDEYPPFSLD